MTIVSEPFVTRAVAFLRVSDRVTGQSQILTTPVDQAGHSACAWQVAFGAITAGATVRLYAQQALHDPAAGGPAAEWEDLGETLVGVPDTASGTTWLLEVARSNNTHRWLRLVIDRADQNAVVDAVSAHLVGGDLPESHGTGITAHLFITPDAEPVPAP